MEADRFREVMSGSFNNLPSGGSQMVRIFASSTFTDTVEERNLLMKNVYPKLRVYCRTKYGLDFQVVDMRWGIRDEATDDHMTSALCLEEIENCQRLSAGPNFVTFLGQRHGSRLFPPVLPAAEFTTLRQCMQSQNRAVTLLDTWFRQDENAVDSVFVLQPISSQYPDFLSQNSERRNKARATWNETLGQLQQLLCLASESCLEQNLISAESYEKFFMSVTEVEIDKGVFRTSGDPANESLCYIRIIDDLREHLSHRLAWRYIDMENGQVNETAQQQLARLRDNRLLDKLRDAIVMKASVIWDVDSGISRATHAQYLSQLCSHFHDSVVRLVDRAMSAELSRDALLTEVLQHARMVQSRCALFQGRTELLQAVRRLTTRRHGVILIHGVSGCGKTSIVAKTAAMVREWIGSQNCVVIVRFMGTTPSSSTIQAILRSVCSQIATTYGRVGLLQCPVDYPDLLAHFQDCLQLASKDRPLYVILDSLDQLSPANSAHKMSWLPPVLPENCTVVLSSLTDMYGILPKLQKKVGDESIIEVQLLGDQLGLEILNHWMSEARRKLSNTQLQVVAKALKNCSLPLYVKIVFDEVKTWRSYAVVSDTQLPLSVRAVITSLFEHLERKHGSVLVQRALGYLTAARSGLSEAELEDVLSLDDVVLTDVFQYHVPPTRRIPSMLWIRIRHDIANYLVTREADGTEVVFWYHRQFIEAATAKYVGQNAQITLHMTLAEFFEGIWHDKGKPFVYTPYQMTKLKLSSSEGKADRRVASQPIIFQHEAQKRYNLRKLNNLPYHLIMSEQKTRCKHLCFFSYTWLYTKLRASGIHALLSDLDMMPTDADCQLLRRVVHLARSTLNLKPNTLALEISGRLLPESLSHQGSQNVLGILVEQCYSLGCLDNCLLSHGQSYHSPGGELQFYLEHEGFPNVDKVTFLSTDGQSLCAVTISNDVIIWDLVLGEFDKLVRCLPNNSPKLNVVGVCKEKVVLGCAFHNDENPIVIFDTVHCELEHVFSLEKVYKGVGFIDSYKLLLVDEFLFVAVVGREGDLYQVPSGRLVASLGFPPGAVCSANSHLLVAHKSESVVKVIDPSTFVTLQEVKVSDKVIGIVYSPGHDLVCVGCDNSTKLMTYSCSSSKGPLHLSEKNIFNVKNSIKEPTKSTFRSLLMSPKGSFVLVYISNNLIIFDIKKGRIVRTFDVASVVRKVDSSIKIPLSGLCFSGDEKFVFASHEEYIFIWSVTYGELIRTLKVEPSQKLDNLQVTSIDEDGCSTHLACTTCRKSNQIKVWNWENRESTKVPPLHMSAACRYMVTAREQTVAIARSYSARETVFIDLQNWSLGHLATDRDISAILVTPCGDYAVLTEVNSADRLCVWSTSSKKAVCKVPVAPLMYKSCCISDSSRYLATHSEASMAEEVLVEVWQLLNACKVSQIKVTSGGFQEMRFADSDRLLLLHQVYNRLEEDGRNCLILVCDVTMGDVLCEFDHVLMSTMCVTPDSRHLLYVRCGETKEANRLVTVSLSRSQGCQQVRESAVVPRGRQLHISADGGVGLDLHIRAIDLVKGQLICEFPGIYIKSTSLWCRLSACGQFAVWVRVAEAAVYVGGVGPAGEVLGVCYLHANPQSLVVHGSDMVAVGLADGRIMVLKIADYTNSDHPPARALESLHAYCDSYTGRKLRTYGLDDDTETQRNRRSAMCRII